MTNRNDRLSKSTNVPELEQVTLTPEEERAYQEVIGRLLEKSPEETDQFLEGHRAETQGQ